MSINGGTNIIVVIVSTIVFGLCSVIWVNLTTQISEMKTSIAVLQTQNSEMQKAMTDLTRRVTDLVETLQAEHKSGHNR